MTPTILIVETLAVVYIKETIMFLEYTSENNILENYLEEKMKLLFQ